MAALFLFGLPACMELSPLDERPDSERAYRRIKLDPKEYAYASRGEVVEEAPAGATDG